MLRKALPAPLGLPLAPLPGICCFVEKLKNIVKNKSIYE
jgi:hypothetical protein